jgi:SAM-dependent methyltransferase
VGPDTRPGAGLCDRGLELLRCPTCSQPLAADDKTEAENRDEPSVSCPAGHRFEAGRGYLDLSTRGPSSDATRRTFDSFGYEWNTFGDVREEDDEFAGVYFRDLDLSTLEGLRGLDVGCGKGRYTRYVAEQIGVLVALDGSEAVEAAARNLETFSNVLVVRCDLRGAPVVPGSFDFVMCLGVLHHLEDPRSGFEELAGLLAAGGRMLLYLYSRPERLGMRGAALWASAQLRKFTTRLSHPVLRALCFPIAGLLYVGVVGAGSLGDRLGSRIVSRLPMSAYRGKPFRSLLLDTFDRLSAPVEHRYVWREIEGWFDGCGLVLDAVREETGWFVLCHRPAAEVPVGPAEP